jgi:hypothetical protein
MELLLGPVFSAGEPNYAPPAAMQPTGVVMEISGTTTYIRLPIYKEANENPYSQYEGPYFVWDADFNQQRWPSAFSIKAEQQHDVQGTPSGNFFRFNTILATLYAANWNLLPLPSMLWLGLILDPHPFIPIIGSYLAC